ncbi:MAG TPA: alpha/beta hydrolase [Solimonas sp.]
MTTDSDAVCWVDREGLRLCSLSLGPFRRTSPTAAPVLMMHGWVTGNMATWYPSYALALARDRQVVLFDQRGHGESHLGDVARRIGFSLDTLSGDLDAVLETHRLGQTPVDLVGYSMGAVSALHYAISHRNRVRRLVLLDAPVPPSRYVAPYLSTIESPDDLHRFFGGLKWMTEGRRRTRSRQRASRLLFETELLRDVAAMDFPSSAQLASLPIPVLMVYGTRSPFRAAGTELARQLPNARLAWLDADHDLVFEHAPALVSMIQTFLDPP